MQLFKDSLDREWQIVVNVATAKTVRDLTTVDIFNLYDKEAERVFTDPILFVNVLYSLCKKQADERGLTDEQFGTALTGDSIETASVALLKEVAAFFPQSRRAILLKMLAKSEATAKQIEAKALAALDQISPTS